MRPFNYQRELVTIPLSDDTTLSDMDEMDRIYYLETLRSYSDPKTIDEFISFIRQCATIIGMIRGDRARLELNTLADLIQLYSDGYFYPYFNASVISRLCIRGWKINPEDYLIMGNMMERGVKLINTTLTDETVYEYIHEIDSNRANIRSSEEVSYVNMCYQHAKAYFIGTEYDGCLPSNWKVPDSIEKFTRRKPEFGDTLYGRINAVLVHILKYQRPSYAKDLWYIMNPAN